MCHPSPKTQKKVLGYVPCLSIDVRHHVMEFTRLFLDVQECMDMSKVHIEKCVCCEIHAMVFTSLPFTQTGIKLTNMSMPRTFIYVRSLAAVPTSANMGIGT